MKNCNRLICLLIMLLLFGACIKPKLTIEQLRKRGPAVAKIIAAKMLGTDTSQVIETTPIVLEAPLSKTYYFIEKFVDRKSGKIVSITLGKDLKEIDENPIIAQERELFIKKFAKIEPALFDTLQKVKDTQKIRVALWLPLDKISMNGRGRTPAEMDMKKIEATFTDRIKMQSEIISKQQKMLIRNLKDMEAKILYISSYAPLIYCELTGDQINKISGYKFVTHIDLGRTYKEEHDSSIPTLRANIAHTRGIKGNGVAIAICENDNVIGTNPNLNVVATKRASLANSAHAAHTAGDAACSDSTFPGVAPEADIYSAGADSWDDDDIMEAIEWAISQGVRIINCSFGSDTDLDMDVLDRYFDYLVRNNWITITKSAGNRGNSDGDVTSPGLAWNIITVGGINDKGNDNWADDVMYGASSFNNPKSTHGDREKPEVCAVGENVRSTTLASPWIQAAPGGSGTSYAAPMVAGAAAIIIERNWALGYWPEIVKAIVMSGATHNIEGAQRLSNKDGAGAINVDLIDRVTRDGQYFGRQLYKSDFNTGGTYTILIPYIKVGDRIKTVLCWDSYASRFSLLWFTFYFDMLGSDFDLALYAPDNSYVGGSYSWDNTFEIIDISAKQNGTYTLKILKYRMDVDWEWVGVAWSHE
jgi:hypothetical protein